jgi:hypothetical protein
MKLRHAAALALVGWYLLMPPAKHNGMPADVPLSRWRNFGAFDSAAQSESALRTQRKSFEAEADKEWDAWDGKGDAGGLRVIQALNHGKGFALHRLRRSAPQEK